MKIKARPCELPFQTTEDFIEKYLEILIGPKKYTEYSSLRASISPQSIEICRQEQERKKKIDSETKNIAERIIYLRATEQDFERQTALQHEYKLLLLDSKVTGYLREHDCYAKEGKKAAILRRSYITHYLPTDRKIFIIEARQRYNMDELYHLIPQAMMADGGIIVDKQEEADDVIFRGYEICDEDSGRPVKAIRHAEETNGYGLLFLDLRPLQEHCRNDWEIVEAKKLAKEGKKIMIFASERGWAISQIYKYL